MTANIALIVFLGGAVFVLAVLLSILIVPPNPYRRHRSKLDWTLIVVFGIGLLLSVVGFVALLVAAIRDFTQHNVIFVVIALVVIGVTTWIALLPERRRHGYDDEFLDEELD